MRVVSNDVNGDYDTGLLDIHVVRRTSTEKVLLNTGFGLIGALQQKEMKPNSILLFLHN